MFDLEACELRLGLFGGLRLFLCDPIEKASLIFAPGETPRL